METSAPWSPVSNGLAWEGREEQLLGTDRTAVQAEARDQEQSRDSGAAGGRGAF